ncbi:NAD synthetase [Pseudomonas antarctica]|uniref:NAD synthetase n=1 Tax=Pseudomonas antarctica TaxID=219572 RepID=UPI003F75386E
MAASLLKDGFPSAHRTTRQRLESSLDLRRLFSAIDADPALIGAGVVYIDEDFNVVTLRDFQAICSVVPKKVVLREAPRYVGPAEFKRMLEHEPRQSKLVAEAVNTAATCAGAVLGWMVITSGFLLMPFTAGTSVIITFIGQAAVAASAAQCLIGVGRTGAEVIAPQALDRVDSDAWYLAATAVLDAIALLGVAASTSVTVKAINVSTKATGKPLRQILRGLTRQERATLNNELLRINDPRLTTKLLKLRQAAGTASKRLSPTQMQRATASHIKDALASTSGLVGSSLTGNVRTIAVGLYEEVKQ